MTSPDVSANSSVLHRRPAYAVNAPALLCHQCYRFRDVAQSGSSELSKIRRNIATIGLNTILFHIQTARMAAAATAPIFVFGLKRLTEKDHSAEERREADDQLRAEQAFERLTAAQSQQIRVVDSQVTILANLPIVANAGGEWSHWRARLRVDLHSEFYSVTYILDARKQGVCPPHTDPASPGLPEDPEGGSQSRQYFNKWYETIWADFFRLFDLPPEKRFPEPDKFFECRGLAIPSAFEPPPRQATARDLIVTPARTKDEMERARADLIAWPNRHEEFARLVLELDRTGEADKDANCILCLVLQGRALFASSMGQPDGGKPAAQAPSGDAARPQFERYLLVHDRLPRFQLGRLLRRFHVLDELRCAAIFDFPELIDASERLRTLGNKIDQRLSEAQATSKKPCLSTRSLSDIQKRLNNLTSGSGLHLVDPQTGALEGRKAAGGLLYRINRSRYYANDFKLRMTDMLIERIEGWESYDLFMHRNLFPIIDHIDSIGQRFDALAGRVERLTEVSDADELINVQNDIAYIQTIGEYIGWTAFAYYAGQILDKFMPELWPSCPLCNCGWFDLCHLMHKHWGTGLSTVIAIGAWFYFRRQRKKRQPERNHD